ncbi:hypothetical protein G7054_g5152 [Neopestalotiopsis clavispora]|nr:hypothetical protein G7054_g5152 [Neopestalotiopsis clavispora]
MKNYKYDPITADEYAFRLILLHPGSEPKITIEIFHALLDTNLDKGLDKDLRKEENKNLYEYLIPYEAVSYVWGSSEMCAPVYVRNPRKSEHTKEFGSDLLWETPAESDIESILYVTNSLELVLRDFRLPDKKRCLWIDGICINQNDENHEQSREKNHQVKLMDKIYNRAERVLLHIGRSTDRTPILRSTLIQLQEHQELQRTHERQNLQGLEQEHDRILQELERLEELEETTEVQKQVRQKTQELEDKWNQIKERQNMKGLENPQKPEEIEESEMSDPEWEKVFCNLTKTYPKFHEKITHSLEDALASSWFQRVWIIQEVANSREASIFWGCTQLSVRWFVDLVRKLGMEVSTHQRAILDMLPRRRRDQLDLSSGQDLYDLLVRFSEAQASKSHDKIFALLGMCKHGKGLGAIDIDYSKDLDCVVRDAVAYMGYCDKSDVPSALTQMHNLTRELGSLFDTLLTSFAKGSKVKSLRSLLRHRGDQMNVTPELIENITNSANEEAVGILLNHCTSTTVVSAKTLEKTLRWGKIGMTEVLLTHCAESLPAMAKWTRAAVAMTDGKASGAGRGAGRMSPLEQAVHNGEINDISQLLEEGADINGSRGRGTNPLARAAIDGQQEIVAILLDHGAQLDIRDSNGRTPLALAIHHGRENIVEILLDRGANINTEDNEGRTPLTLAVQNGTQDVVEFLLARGADINTKDKKGRTQLALAVQNGTQDVVEFLLARGADINTKDNNGRTPLSLAASGGCDKILSLGSSKIGRQIVRRQKKERYSAKKDFDISQDSPTIFKRFMKRIRLAKAMGIMETESDRSITEVGTETTRVPIDPKYSALLQLLLDKGAKVNSADNAKQTSLWWAVNYGHQVAVEKLLENGARPEETFGGHMSLFSWTMWNSYDGFTASLLESSALGVFPADDSVEWAIRAGKEHLLKELIDRRAKTHSTSRITPSPLLVAITEHNDAAFQDLLQNHMFLESHLSISEALFKAVSEGRVDYVEALLDTECDVNYEDSDGNTPLSRAVGVGSCKMVQLLLAKNSNPHGSKENRSPPLVGAVGKGNITMVRALIESKANVNAKWADTNALGMAVYMGHRDIVRLLIDNGAQIVASRQKGETLLMWACKNRDQPMVELLLNEDMDINDRDYASRTALDWAKSGGSKSGGNHQIVQILEDRLTQNQ